MKTLIPADAGTIRRPYFSHSPQAEMANNHPDAPKQFGIRLREETMEVVSEIQLYRQRTNQTITLTPIG